VPSSQEEIQQLVTYSRESLAVEIKNWFDASSAEGQAKIVKACIALRNQNGGSLLVGFENGTWTPNLAGAPADVRSEWDADDIQALVSRFASVPFEVHLQLGERGGQEFLVLAVESGVRTPVASK
jgi:predicted HTH transcriptional regulator